MNFKILIALLLAFNSWSDSRWTINLCKQYRKKIPKKMPALLSIFSRLTHWQRQHGIAEPKNTAIYRKSKLFIKNMIFFRLSMKRIHGTRHSDIAFSPRSPLTWDRSPALMSSVEYVVI